MDVCYIIMCHVLYSFFFMVKKITFPESVSLKLWIVNRALEIVLDYANANIVDMQNISKCL